MENYEEDYKNYGSEGTEEYRKLTKSIVNAENNRKHLEKKIYELRLLLKDLDKDLNVTEKEVIRLRSIQKNMIKSSHKEDERHSSYSRSPVRMDSEYDYKQLFVHRLDPRTTETDLHTFFRKFGHVVNVRIVKDHFTGRNRGFAYISFSHEHMAKAALNHRPHWIVSRMVETSYYVKKPDSFKEQKKSYRSVPY